MATQHFKQSRRPSAREELNPIHPSFAQTLALLDQRRHTEQEKLALVELLLLQQMKPYSKKVAIKKKEFVELHSRTVRGRWKNAIHAVVAARLRRKDIETGSANTVDFAAHSHCPSASNRPNYTAQCASRTNRPLTAPTPVYLEHSSCRRWAPQTNGGPQRIADGSGMLSRNPQGSQMFMSPYSFQPTVHQPQASQPSIVMQNPIMSTSPRYQPLRQPHDQMEGNTLVSSREENTLRHLGGIQQDLQCNTISGSFQSSQRPQKAPHSTTQTSNPPRESQNPSSIPNAQKPSYNHHTNPDLTPAPSSSYQNPLSRSRDEDQGPFNAPVANNSARSSISLREPDSSPVTVHNNVPFPINESLGLFPNPFDPIHPSKILAPKTLMPDEQHCFPAALGSFPQSNSAPGEIQDSSAGTNTTQHSPAATPKATAPESSHLNLSVLQDALEPPVIHKHPPFPLHSHSPAPPAAPTPSPPVPTATAQGQTTPIYTTSHLNHSATSKPLRLSPQSPLRSRSCSPDHSLSSEQTKAKRFGKLNTAFSKLFLSSTATQKRPSGSLPPPVASPGPANQPTVHKSPPIPVNMHTWTPQLALSSKQTVDSLSQTTPEAILCTPDPPTQHKLLQTSLSSPAEQIAGMTTAQTNLNPPLKIQSKHQHTPCTGTYAQLHRLQKQHGPEHIATTKPPDVFRTVNADALVLQSKAQDNDTCTSQSSVISTASSSCPHIPTHNPTLTPLSKQFIRPKTFGIQPILDDKLAAFQPRTCALQQPLSTRQKYIVPQEPYCRDSIGSYCSSNGALPSSRCSSSSQTACCTSSSSLRSTVERSSDTSQTAAHVPSSSSDSGHCRAVRGQTELGSSAAVSAISPRALLRWVRPGCLAQGRSQSASLSRSITWGKNTTISYNPTPPESSTHSSVCDQSLRVGPGSLGRSGDPRNSVQHLGALGSIPGHSFHPNQPGQFMRQAFKVSPLAAPSASGQPCSESSCQANLADRRGPGAPAVVFPGVKSPLPAWAGWPQGAEEAESNPTSSERSSASQISDVASLDTTAGSTSFHGVCPYVPAKASYTYPSACFPATDDRACGSLPENAAHFHEHCDVEPRSSASRSSSSEAPGWSPSTCSSADGCSAVSLLPFASASPARSSCSSLECLPCNRGFAHTPAVRVDTGARSYRHTFAVGEATQPLSWGTVAQRRRTLVAHPIEMLSSSM